jgi:hypothetical protein
VTGKKETKWGSWAVTIGIWVLIAWLLAPLIKLNNIYALNAKEYLYRSAIGIMLMIILLGRNVFDMFMIYSLGIAGVIIFMVARIIELYVGNALSETNF